MAPIQKMNQQNNQRRTLRSTNGVGQNKTEEENDQKRKAECSPPKDQKFKRYAFTEITNVSKYI